MKMIIIFPFRLLVGDALGLTGNKYHRKTERIKLNCFHSFEKIFTNFLRKVMFFILHGLKTH
jgi:hypothetical protein